MSSQVRDRAALLSFLIILSIGLIGCRSKKNSGFKNSLKTLTLKQDLRISANNPKVLIGGFGRLAVDNSGNIYTPDFREAKIHVFGPDGSYLDSLGRRGKGPGEFTYVSSIHLRGDTLFARDFGIRPLRITMYNIKTRKFIGSYDFPKIKRKKGTLALPNQVFPAGNDRFEVAFVGSLFGSDQTTNHVTMVIMKAELKGIKDTLAILPPDHYLFYRTKRMIRNFASPFLSNTLIKAGPDGTFYTAVTDSMCITGYNESGKVINTFRAGYNPPVLKKSEIDSIRDTRYKNISGEFNQALEKIKVPTHWPAIRNFLVDDLGRCWVELMNPGKPKQTWWVFNTDGEPEWKFKLPTDIQLYVVKKGEVYGIEMGKDGLPAIVRYKINTVEMRNG